jgi:hypothetical protein
MKNRIIILLAFLSIAVLSNAQDEKPSKFGIRAGWHYSIIAIDGEQISATDPLNSFYIGIFQEKKLVPLLRFGSGLEYFQNGFESSRIDLQRKLHYISVPLYLKVKIGPIYATGGTALNFKVAEKSNLWDASIDPLGESSKIFDLPLQVGVGLKILMFSVEARYNWGLLAINSNDAKNQYLQFGITFSF